MASNQLPLGSGFILTPQQQSLLFAALNSNKPVSSPHNSVLSLSPTSISQSPHQSNDAGATQDNSYLDYGDISFNPDSSYDFDLSGIEADASQGQMIGDLPESTKSETPTSPDSHEKRSRSEDGAEQESSPKRRESTDKVPKKPGRKPLTSEPSSKRKAQNRAAQRAFRERKEKHLKDLETKVEELEKASESDKHENEKLRSQIDKMTVELNEYKKRISLLTNTRSVSSGAGFQWGNAAVSNLNDVNFHFEFPKFGSLPGPAPSQVTNGNQRSSSIVSKDSQTSPKTVSTASPASPANALGLSMSRSTDDFSNLDGLFGPAFTNNSMGTGNKNSLSYSTDSGTFNLGATNTSSPSASSGSNLGASSSCGTSPEPFNQSPMGFKPLDTLTTIGEENAVATTTSNSANNHHLSGVELGNLDWMNQTHASFNPQLFGNYREPQENILSNGFDDPSFFNDAFDIDFLTPFNAPESVVQPKKDILAEIDAQKMDDAPSTANPPANFSGKLLTCNKIWEKLQACPRVQNADFDLDSLCKDLKNKAKCTGSGPMVDEKDFKDVIQKYVKPECANEALRMVKKPGNP